MKTACNLFRLMMITDMAQRHGIDQIDMARNQRIERVLGWCTAYPHQFISAIDCITINVRRITNATALL
jgi:hypothetical protein